MGEKSGYPAGRCQKVQKLRLKSLNWLDQQKMQDNEEILLKGWNYMENI